MASNTPEDGFGFGHKGSYFPGHERKMGFGFNGTRGQDFFQIRQKEKESKVS
jgi:hypothetical protein